MPLVKLMPNMQKLTTLVENDNALGLHFKLIGKRSGALFHWDTGSNTSYNFKPWFKQGEKVLHRSLARAFELSNQN